MPGSSGGGAAKRVKKEEADAVVKTEPGVDPNEPVDLTALSSDDDDDDETLADLVKPRRRGSRAAGDGRRYPPTISFDDPFSPRAMPVRCPPNWHTVDGANAAAERLSNEIRLLGVATLTLASPPGEPRVRDTLESLASPGIRATRRTVRKNYRGPAGCETWNDVGEPGAPQRRVRAHLPTRGVRGRGDRARRRTPRPQSAVRALPRAAPGDVPVEGTPDAVRRTPRRGRRRAQDGRKRAAKPRVQRTQWWSSWRSTRAD